MSGWKKVLLALAVLLGALTALAWLFPARWAVALIEPRLHGTQVREVSGLLWNGRAGRLVSAQGDPLGELHWTLSRRLLLGQLRMHVQLDGPAAEVSGDLSRAGQDLVWRDVHGVIRLAELPRPPKTPWGVPTGVLALQIAQTTLRGGWPMSLRANGQWNNAAFKTERGDIALGQFDGRASGENGVIDAQWRDRGQGPLRLTGRLQLSPLGWRLTATLQPRTDDPALRQWLATLGRPDASGVVHIQHGAGLGATFSTSGVSR